MSERFFDDRKTVYAFNGDTLVRCPRCESRARSARIDSANLDWFAPRRLTCLSCGYASSWAKREISRGWREARDDYFELPLWLQTACCGETLWAYDIDHLEFIERFVRAELRERAKDAERGWMNASLASRLPQWLKAAKNRAQILRAIKELRRRA